MSQQNLQKQPSGIWQPIGTFIREDITAIIGLVGLGAQLSFLKEFGIGKLPSVYLYMIGCIIIIVLSNRAICRIRDSKGRVTNKQRRAYRITAAVYLICACVAMSIIVCRYLYLHSAWIPFDDHRPVEQPEIGAINSQILLVSNVKVGSLQVDMLLDDTRTSQVCTQSRSAKSGNQTPLSVRDCTRYSIPPERAQHLTKGSGIADTEEAVSKYNTKYLNEIILPTYRALEVVAEWRGKDNLLLQERKEELIRLAMQSGEWKRKLMLERLLPDAAEWARLTKEHPQWATGLRHFMIEWIGWPDPFFHVTFTNISARPIRVTRIGYTAMRETGYPSAQLVGDYATPRYILPLKAGHHIFELNPIVIVQPNSTRDIDLMIRLTSKEPPGSYLLTLTFQDASSEVNSTMPGFTVQLLQE